MPQFRTWSSLSDYLQKSSSGTEKILKAQNNLRQIFEDELRTLYEIIQDNISEYYASYTPSIYKRTEQWMEAFTIEPIIYEGNVMKLEITTVPEYGYHPSLWGGDDGFVPWLMEAGWSINWSHPYRINRLSDFEGTHYLSNSIVEFNETNKYGIKFQLFHNGELVNIV